MQATPRRGTFRITAYAALGALVLAVGCGGSTPPAEEPTPTPKPTAEPEPAPTPEGAGGAGAEGSDGGSSESPKEPQPDKPAPIEPKFTEGMTVDQAMKAIPQGMSRENIDEETLGMPLRDVTLYEPCKLGAKHVKLRVAVWNGKAVGLDVTVTPKHDKTAQCIRDQINKLEWKDKARSLNVIEYGL